MCFIDQHQIAVPDLRHPGMDGLDAGEQDAGGNVTLLQARRVDAGRRLGPQAFQLSVVLLDELTHMSDDQDALIGPGLEHAFDEARHDQGFAPRRDRAEGPDR